MDKISIIANNAIHFYEQRDIYNCMNLLGELYNVAARAGSINSDRR